MDQFDVHRLRAASESDEAPELVVILQHGHARAVDTVIVAPVVPTDRLRPLGRVRPPFQVDGEEHVAVVDRLAAVERQSIAAASARSNRIVTTL